MMQKNLSKNWVLFFNWKIKKNKLFFLLFSLFFVAFFIDLTLALLLEFSLKSFVSQNSRLIKNFASVSLFINIFLLIFVILASILLILCLWFGWKSAKKFRQNYLYLKGLSLHFEADFVKKDFLIEHKLWSEFTNFDIKKGEKIAKFDQLYNGSILLSLSKKTKITNFASSHIHILEEINIYINDFRLRDYKVNYFEEIRKIYNNLLIMSFLSFILSTLFWISIIVVIFYFCFPPPFFHYRNYSELKIPAFFNSSVSLTIFMLIAIFSFGFFLKFHFSEFRKYLIIYYKVFAVGLANFKKIENFAENEEFKNSLYIAIKKKNKISRPLDLDSDIFN
ncbi:hypothetical protein MFC_00026 [Mesomycoplasma flocculare ATCC 27716]|nr:hypothetical protein MFC_00026 [Mesomycoplasma flocculare ATCC 27716]